jgi:DNA-3-methyladenine glycosylase I
MGSTKVTKARAKPLQVKAKAGAKATPSTGTKAKPRTAAKAGAKATPSTTTKAGAKASTATARRVAAARPPTPRPPPPPAADGLCRCPWAGADPLYVAYHDTEWGVPVHDDRRLFEFLVLEGAQAGLAWITILRKREGYRRAFADFDAEKVARFGEADVARLLGDPGIVRNRMKIEAAIGNARAFLRVVEEHGSFDAYQWQFVGGAPIVAARATMKDVPPTSPESDAWSKDLKRRGFRFVGSTIVYAHMQAVGMVNDHLTTCFRYAPLASPPPRRA